jgi:GNAT superfamily N-acetyltransferase
MSDGGSILSAEICLRERWPARENIPLSGWIIRTTLGVAHRPNSVWTGGEVSERNVDWAIDSVEAFYAERRMPARFQMLVETLPRDLDDRLARRGYRREHHSLGLAKAVVPRPVPDNVTITPEMSDAWKDLYTDAQDADRLPEHFDILSLIEQPAGFIVAHADGKPAGVALAGRTGDDVAIDCVLTHPAIRRSGAATAVMHAAEAWAAEQGAARLLLMVGEANAPPGRSMPSSATPRSPPTTSASRHSSRPALRRTAERFLPQPPPRPMSCRGHP